MLMSARDRRRRDWGVDRCDEDEGRWEGKKEGYERLGLGGI